MTIGNTINTDYLRKFFQLKKNAQDKPLFDFIVSNLVLREYKHNSFICRAGDEADDIYFIESGVIIVRGKDGEISNELEAGSFFGEYAAITGEKRIADIQAKGTVTVYALNKKALIKVARKKPGLFKMFLRNAYNQATENYRKMTRAIGSKRGLGTGFARKKMSLPLLCLNYFLVAAVFFAAYFFAPYPLDAGGPDYSYVDIAWLCSPILFLVGYLIITQRALESLVLSTLYVMVLCSKLNFIGDFTGQLLDTTSEVTDIILLMLLMGSMTRLFTVSGSINAIKNVVQKKIKSSKGTLFTSFFSMVLIALDEYLSILINGACFKPLADQKRISREKSALVLGFTPNALCILSPLSITGIYLTGVITLATGERGLFLESIKYNFGAFIAIIFVILLIFEKLPVIGSLKKAETRVKEGGSLWPEGTEVSLSDDKQSSMGRTINLILPVLVLIVSSIVVGTLEAGTFQVNILYGIIITMIFSFLLYCLQRYMTPEQFVNHFINGIENMIAPVVIFLVGECFARGMGSIGFTEWLNVLVGSLIQGQAWLLPVIIFGVCTFVCVLFDNNFAMFAICIPIAAGLAATTGGNTALYISAVCAAGFIGNEISLGDIFFIGPMLGVNPMCYYRAKLPYMIAITALTFCAYTAAGFIISAL